MSKPIYRFCNRFFFIFVLYWFFGLVLFCLCTPQDLQYKTPIGAMFTLHVLILFFLFIIFCYLLFTVFYLLFLFLMAARLCFEF
jgi:hypothetical protein